MILAVDIGGTKTLLALFNNNGEITWRHKFPTSQNYPIFLNDFNAAAQLINKTDLTACSVGAPGKIDRTTGTGVVFGNLGWQNVALKADFEKILNIKVNVENDAKLAAFYESATLEHKFARCLYLTISTGIGVGLVVNGQIDTSTNDLGGKEIMVNHKNQQVIWESFASGKAIVRRFGKLAAEIEDEATWKMIASDINSGLSKVVAEMRPDVVVFGGGVGANFKRFIKYLREELQKSLPSEVKLPELLQAKHPEEAVIYGCYHYAKVKLS